jgi:hypothetical protein
MESSGMRYNPGRTFWLTRKVNNQTPSGVSLTEELETFQYENDIGMTDQFRHEQLPLVKKGKRKPDTQETQATDENPLHPEPSHLDNPRRKEQYVK